MKSPVLPLTLTRAASYARIPSLSLLPLPLPGGGGGGEEEEGEEGGEEWAVAMYVRGGTQQQPHPIFPPIF